MVRGISIDRWTCPEPGCPDGTVVSAPDMPEELWGRIRTRAQNKHSTRHRVELDRLATTR